MLNDHEKEHLARFSAAFGDFVKTFSSTMERPVQTMADGFAVKVKLDRAVYEWMDFANAAVWEENQTPESGDDNPPPKPMVN